jgi:hypothetical protein
MFFKVLKVVTTRRRLGLPGDVIQRLEREDETMRTWLKASDDEEEEQNNLQSRQSGTEDWKEARGEDGPST